MAPVLSGQSCRRERWPLIWVSVAAVAIVLIAERPAYAYIDPGSGSLIYQALLAGLLGLGFTLRHTYSSITRFVRRVFGGRDVKTEKADPDRV